MSKAEDFYKIYVPDITKRITPQDAISLMEMFAKEAYPDYKKGEAEFCGKCGTVI